MSDPPGLDLLVAGCKSIQRLGSLSYCSNKFLSGYQQVGKVPAGQLWGGMQTEGAAAWAPGVGAGQDLAPGDFEWDRLAAVQDRRYTCSGSRSPPRLVRRQHAGSAVDA